jgi:hypothetical protein
MIIITQINYLIISYDIPYSQMYTMDNLQIWLKPAKLMCIRCLETAKDLFLIFVFMKKKYKLLKLNNIIYITEIKQCNINLTKLTFILY